ncbi:MAG: hypothetical protein KF878_15560 [Planctomycetes bacterium]|nr:hypothetical protein [Planctomycetota bacterium]
MTPTELQRALAQPEPPVVLDVRQPEELALARLEGVLHVPMGEIPGRVDDLPRDRPLVVMCHHGVRSAHVVAFLRQAHGFEQVENLEGGIDAWSCDVDPGVPRY